MSTFKKVLLALTTAVLLVLLGGTIAVLLTARAERNAAEREQAQRRASRKFRIGDSQQVVRLRIGMPDSVGRQPAPFQKEVVWHYRPAGAGDELAAIVFDSLKQVDRVFAVGSYLWPPEDELSPSDFDDADRAIQMFKNKLGAPCDTSYAEKDSSWVRFYYRLHASELRADSVYRTLEQKGLTTLRFLEVNLRSGKAVMYHGWVRGSCAPKGRSSPSESQ